MQLGGSVSALIGLSFGAPAVTLEAPGDLLPAKRLHLPLPPGVPAEKSGITHAYHTADPIPMGLCTGAYSGCYAAGFVSHIGASTRQPYLTCCQAMESKCHTGQTILYDTVTVKGWSVDIRTHRIGEIINKVLMDPWPTNDDPDPSDPEPSEPKHPKQKKPKMPDTPPSKPDLPSGGGGDGDEDDGPPDDPWYRSWFRWGWGRKGPPKGGDGGDDDDGGGDKDGGGWERHGGVPKAKSEEPCVDCFKWSVRWPACTGICVLTRLQGVWRRMEREAKETRQGVKVYLVPQPGVVTHYRISDACCISSHTQARTYTQSDRDGLEEVEGIAGGADDRARNLRVPVQLLDVLLALVDKQELWRDIGQVAAAGNDAVLAVGGRERRRGRLVLVLLDRQVPQRDLVIRARRGEHGGVGRVPFDRGDGRSVPGKVSDRCWFPTGACQQQQRITNWTLYKDRLTARQTCADPRL